MSQINARINGEIEKRNLLTCSIVGCCMFSLNAMTLGLFGFEDSVISLLFLFFFFLLLDFSLEIGVSALTTILTTCIEKQIQCILQMMFYTCVDKQTLRATSFYFYIEGSMS